MVILAVVLCLSWLGWTLSLWLRHRQSKAINKPLTTPVLVAYASQTGTARALALQQQQALGGPGQVSVMALSELAPLHLAQVRKAVFVVSTYGDGEPPDNGRRFYLDLQALSKEAGTKKQGAKAVSRSLLSSLDYEVLALGDRTYPKFCQFGEDLCRELTKLGAKTSSPIKKLDQNQPVQTSAVTQCWQLVARERLNTNTDAGLFKLRLNPLQPLPDWRAGDIVAIHPNNDIKAASRRYSVASVPADGTLSLIVRQHLNESGSMGLCSGWLTSQAQLGDIINLQVIYNPSCYISNHQAPLLLIGAGSGLAGICGHLAERRQQTKAGPAWLIYGERDTDRRQLLHAELAQWQQRGVLDILDCAFSRDIDKPAYVQDIVGAKANEIANFLDNEGHVYVCGRYEGMGLAVDAVLRTVLGPDKYQHILEQGRYHRDLY